MLTSPLPDLESWTRYLAAAPIPVLRRSVREARHLAADADRMSPRDIAQLATRDPLLTARIFALMAEKRAGRRSSTEITSVEGCVFMLGVPPTLNALASADTVEDHLRQTPHALRGLLRVMRRARKAQHYAWDFARWRTDLGIEEIAMAALLHDLAEMLLWCFAPTLCLTIQQLQRDDPSLRSRVAQRRVLNVELHGLQLALFREWRMPELLVEAMDDDNATQPRICNVLYAVNLARHSARGWDNPALPTDYENIARLLNTSSAFVQHQLETGHGLSQRRSLDTQSLAPVEEATEAAEATTATTESGAPAEPTIP